MCIRDRNNGAKPGGRAAVDVPKLQKLVKDQGFLIDGGYGKIKGTTFRVSNMGDETEATMSQLFAAMDLSLIHISLAQNGENLPLLAAIWNNG